MDFSTQLDDLQQRAADAKTSAQAAVSESRDQLRQRIDQAKVDVDLAAKDARQQVGEAAASARSKWAQMKADVAAKTDDLQARIDKRADQKRQVLADHQWQTVQQEEQQNEQLLQLSNQILELTKAIHAMNSARSPAGSNGTEQAARTSFRNGMGDDQE